jgi:hypothetical protein
MAPLRLKLHRWQEAQARDSADDEKDRDQWMQELLAMVTDENAAEIVQSLSADELNTPFGIAALHHWMQVDPVKAANWIASRPDTTAAQNMAVADDWLGNRAGLQKYIDQLPDNEWKQNFLSDLGSEMSARDPQSAIQLAQQMHSGDAQKNLLQSVACNWVGTDPGAALNWVASVQDPSLREPLIASAVQSYALTDPTQAASWLVSEVKSDAIVKDTALNILKVWAVKNPAEAANWVSQFPEGDTKAAAVQIVSQYLRLSNPGLATSWLQGSSGGNQTPAN